MDKKARNPAFIRGYCSARELFPAGSRKEFRDGIIASQNFSVHSAWEQVGNLLREACEQQIPSGKEPTIGRRKRIDAATRALSTQR